MKGARQQLFSAEQAPNWNVLDTNMNQHLPVVLTVLFCFEQACLIDVVSSQTFLMCHAYSTRVLANAS